MDTTMAQMFGKPNDYKQCKSCRHPNWYENESCVECRGTKFRAPGVGITKWLEEDYEYYMEEKGYTEQEVDNILVDI